MKEKIVPVHSVIAKHNHVLARNGLVLSVKSTITDVDIPLESNLILGYGKSAEIKLIEVEICMEGGGVHSAFFWPKNRLI